MDLDQFLTWYFSHNTILINLVIVAILVLVAFTLVFSFRKSDSSAAGVNGSIDELEKTLRRVLDSMALQTTPAAAQAAAAAIMDEETPSAVKAESVAALEELQKTVGDKEKVILELRTSLEQLNQKSSLTDDQRLKIAQLERDLAAAKSRLSEYEIIEDDIANLSLYKAENTQLKSEIEKLRRGKSGGAKKDEDANAVPAVSEIVSEFAAIVGAEDPAKAAPPPAKPAAPVEPAPAPAFVSAPAVEAKPAAPAPAPTAKEEPAGDPLAVDPAKLITEATNLPDAKEEPGGEEDKGDSGQKLISEFESFIKNG